MFSVYKNAWKIPELKKKILYTLLLLFIYRLGCAIPVAGINTAVMTEMVDQYSILGYLNMFSGGLANFTIFAMGITPYINASIIMNLLSIAIPALERMAKEGEDGQKKIAKITRYLTIALAFVQSIGIVMGLGNTVFMDGNPTIWNYIVIGLTVTAGTMFAMWLGERITEKGVGNGISLLIFVSIVSRLPQSVLDLGDNVLSGVIGAWVIPAAIVFLLVVVVGVVYVDTGERRIPVQYAKRVVGRKMYGGQSSHIPVKVNSSGVLPIIFASTLLSLPSMIAQFWPNSGFSTFWETNLGAGTWPYMLIYALLIVFFTYFYTSVSFNPVEISKNIQQQGGFIPGIRPGKPTSDYLGRISRRLTLFGALFLAVLATIPSLITGFMQMGAFAPTSVMIAVSVALETSKQLESQMLMRHYKGFLK
ncbi:MAG: preprotein translocase subunit SecY [Christensenellales bacterium]|jgi:preprotein translocase subunit SecY